MNLLKRASVAALLHDLDARSPAGCAIGLHIRFTTPLYMFQSYPKRWMDQYAGRGLLVVDPTVHWGMNNVGSVRWRDLESIDTHGVLDRARDFGIMNGVTIALLLDGSRSIASFARSDRDYDACEIAELELTFSALHRVTATPDDLADEDRLALKDLSVRLTH
ncbi:autoinducer binding domain-containing protein [Amaricoccus sp.]|uniref:autoinducer binding domain-containing protein n=1 Tax=Amaricoccus sp. TaxID=1872485 RepID=UPI0026045993|nr:autoinducer binding domain-containing protein [uncultured Amaricoccus sp.]